jgi:hypothetical protein
MTDEVRTAVLAVLRDANLHGLVRTSFCGSVHTGLPWWKRQVNRVTAWLGGDKLPFTDPLNYSAVVRVSLETITRPALIDDAMRELAPDPRCRKCGSDDLEADPAGYYCDAVDYRGAPLLCRKCPG